MLGNLATNALLTAPMVGDEEYGLHTLDTSRQKIYFVPCLVSLMAAAMSLQ